MLKTSGIALIFFSSAFSPLTVNGQSSQAVDRSQLFRTDPGLPVGQTVNQNGESMGYAAPTANDEDLGVQAVLKRQEEYKPFTLAVSLPGYFTSNVALARTDERGDFVFAPAFIASYQPRLKQTLYGEIMVSQQLFYYDRYNEFNFTSLDVIAGLVWYLPQLHNLTLRARYDFNRLTDDNFNEFYQNNSVILSADLPLNFGRAMQLNVGLLTNLSFAADHEEPRRNDFDFHADYAVQFSRAFSADAGVRVIFKDYYQGDRQDVSEILSLTANYRVRDWLMASVVGTYAFNQSNQSVFDYQVGNIGGAFALTVKF